MTHLPLTQQRGLALARRMKERLLKEGIPVVNVVLFGSLAQGTTNTWSDVDIAVIYKPFGMNRAEEYMHIGNSREDFSVPMDIVCLRQEDMDNQYSTIIREVEKNGIPV